MLVMGLATWAQLALLPTLARPSVWALVSTVPSLVALVAGALYALSPAGLDAPLRRRVLLAMAGAFPAGLSLSALWVGRQGITRFDLTALLLGASTAAGYGLALSAWWSASAPRLATVSVPAPAAPRDPAAPALAQAPVLASLARIVVAVAAFGLAVLAPAWIATTAHALPSPAGEMLLRGRAALVSAAGLGLGVALTLSAGSGLLRRGVDRVRSPSRALWLLAGGFAAVTMRLWLDRAR